MSGALSKRKQDFFRESCLLFFKKAHLLMCIVENRLRLIEIFTIRHCCITEPVLF